ncbi:hypothetical protein DKX38_006232 [Salix brachista]|uniref:CCHC-type domain-containing protein n=1 Tax=Salix brachista TaxID=2182728 RepID=A0A5N5N1B8_9ROSI|nr:hypothetical protein DKX38_006232 [Salix brachista]
MANPLNGQEDIDDRIREDNMITQTEFRAFQRETQQTLQAIQAALARLATGNNQWRDDMRAHENHRERFNPVREQQQIPRRQLAYEEEDRVSMHTIYTLTEAINLATKEETQLERTRNPGAARTPDTIHMHASSVAASNKGKFPLNPPPSMPNFTKGPSSSRLPMTTTGTVPPEAPRNPYSRPASDKCYRCGQPGHRSNQCPKRGVVNLIEQGEDTDPEGEDEAEDVYGEEEIIGGDEGELLSHALVVRRLLLTPKQENQSQRHNIFRTRCTVDRKVCDIIIDNGSSENIISRTMVTKLGLKTEKHPSPYIIGWIKQGVETKVTETCHIQFSIGRNYADKITCDVVEMDACHMIFGRPWQYDVDATYRGRDNVYVFMSGGQKIVLGPLKEDFSKIEPKVQGKPILLVDGETFMTEANGASEVFAVVVGDSVIIPDFSYLILRVIVCIELGFAVYKYWEMSS